VQLLTTLIKPDNGWARVCGLDVVREAAPLRSVIGLAGQYAAVVEMLTGRENLELAGRLYHLGKDERRGRADEVLERFSLPDAANRLVKTYSGGMRRRLDLGASLVGRPSVLILDEPMTRLDPPTRNELSALTTPALAVSDIFGIAQRNLLRIARTPQLLFLAGVQPVMPVLLFRYVFGGSITVPGHHYVDYLLPGIFVQTALFGGAATSVGLAEDLKGGVIDRFRTLQWPARRSSLAGPSPTYAITASSRRWCWSSHSFWAFASITTPSPASPASSWFSLSGGRSSSVFAASASLSCSSRSQFGDTTAWRRDIRPVTDFGLLRGQLRDITASQRTCCDCSEIAAALPSV
jgi:ABC transporter family protein